MYTGLQRARQRACLRGPHECTAAPGEAAADRTTSPDPTPRLAGTPLNTTHTHSAAGATLPATKGMTR
jgi:hypothetical protein